MTKPSHTIEQLTQAWAATRRLGAPAQVTGVTADSRRVQPGSIFVAVRGFQTDGHQFIAEAVQRGAVGVVYQEPAATEQIPESVTAIQVDHSRRALAELAAAFYGHPSADLTLVGVTGTNGKTTVVLMLDSIARAAGKTTGVIGTLGVTVAGETRESAHTTPDGAELPALLAEMRDAGVSHVSMEVSSHGLALDRVWRCKFDAAIFTNLGQDHMDFHRNPEEYYQTKRRLFADYADLSRPEKELVGVINLDDPVGERLVREAKCRVVTYGVEKQAQIRGRDLHSTSQGLRLRVEFPEDSPPLLLSLPLIGRFNAYNALAAAACAWTLGYLPKSIREGLESLQAVPGRFEHVTAGQDFTVVVDYAHTPDALQNVLTAIRALQPRRVLCVVGCGGDRDRSKRPQMARIATTQADYTVLTSDNPRSEDPRAILEEMVTGARGEAYTVVPDRREAIFSAVRQCRPGDVLVIAGKGHETYQIIGDQTLPFDDREVAREALQ